MEQATQFVGSILLIFSDGAPKGVEDGIVLENVESVDVSGRAFLKSDSRGRLPRMTLGPCFGVAGFIEAELVSVHWNPVSPDVR